MRNRKLIAEVGARKRAPARWVELVNRKEADIR